MLNPRRFDYKTWYDLSRDAGFDAAEASARKAGRKAWNEDDRDLCAQVWNQMLDMHPDTIKDPNEMPTL